MSLTITDDEAVAIALARKGYWPGPLPTIAAGEAPALSAAAFRGHRSLVARDLVDGDGEILLGDESTCVEPVVGASRFLEVFRTDGEFERARFSGSMVHYPAAGGWVLETVFGTGLHTLSVQPAADHRMFITQLLVSTLRTGDGLVADGPSVGRQGAVGGRSGTAPQWLCLSCVVGEVAMVLAVQQAGVKTFKVSQANPSRTVTQEPSPERLAELVEELFEAVTGPRG